MQEKQEEQSIKEKFGSANRLYKDRVFKYIFGTPENRQWTLSLYNALNGTSYDNPDDIEINTIEDVLYMGMKNDVSFIFRSILEMNLYEQQSTFNPNTPVRFLIYAGMLFAAYIEAATDFNIYSSRLQKLPVPKCICFYNGTDEQEDIKVLKLSDAFPKGAKADIEVTVTMININHGHNEDIMKNCRPLYEYSWLVEEIRQNSRIAANVGEAVDKALDSMPDDFVIKEFLMKNRAEVKHMCITEYDEERVFNALRKEEREIGREEGMAKGIEKGIEKGMAKGIEKGVAKGTLLTLAGLIKDGILSIADAAGRADMSVEEFKHRIAELNI